MPLPRRRPLLAGLITVASAALIVAALVVPDAIARPAQGAFLPGAFLRLHHLGLPAPLSPLSEPDLVAALSELVGFDPEPGVYCLAPALAPADVHRSALTSAARRIAQVYGLPLLRYRSLELAVVPGQRGSTEG